MQGQAGGSAIEKSSSNLCYPRLYIQNHSQLDDRTEATHCYIAVVCSFATYLLLRIHADKRQIALTTIPVACYAMYSLLKWTITHIAPIFIVTSPVTSYADQIWSINKTHSSAGFSLDIPLIMLVASITKVFYWIGNRYDMNLFVQASVMLVVQVLLLHVALSNRPPVGAQYPIEKPFAAAMEGDSYVTRPFNFWQWRSRKPYWDFVMYFTLALAVLEVLLGFNGPYITLQGYFALGVEAILPVPQVMENERRKSCKGFRLSVLANWLIGDVFKMTYFFMSAGSVPLAFKLCGLVQTACDCYLGVQYWRFGTGEREQEMDVKDVRRA